jgi:hypothetical protein
MWVLVGVLLLAVQATSSRLSLLQPAEPMSDKKWKEFYASVEHPKPTVKSPQELAEQFKKDQRAKAKAAHKVEEYLHSDAYTVTVMRRANKMANMARHNRSDQIVDQTMRCGSRVPVTHLGINNTAENLRILQAAYPKRTLSLKSFVQQFKVGPSMAQPASGATQVLADNGRDQIGTISSAEKGEVVTPFLKVFKDGYSFAMCATDGMYDYSDKYGENKDQYKSNYNVSIVRYEDIVLKDKQEPMSPKKCYEFCRTVPDMVYFGIRAGRHCYCTPFPHKAAGSSEKCDLPCPGDPTVMCGGKEKSVIYEMHMCADTAGDLLYMAVKAEVELVYFFDTAFMTKKIADHLQKNGEELQKLAGAAGDTSASDLAQSAKAEAASLYTVETGWGVCQREYTALLDYYDKAKPLYDADFTFAKKLQQAEDSMFMMESYKNKLHACAEEAEIPILVTYPFYFEYMAALDEPHWQETQDEWADTLIFYSPILAALDPSHEKGMSTCGGKPIGHPMPLPLASCAAACDKQTEPKRCVAFQYFQVQDGDEQRPLCFLLQEVKEITTYRCDELGIMGTRSHVSERTFRGNRAAANHTTNATSAFCAAIKKTKEFSGLSCQSMFGKASKAMEHCKEECEDTTGHKITTVCMHRNSMSVPNMAKETNRHTCFDKEENPSAEQKNSNFMLVEFGHDASGGAGPKIDGNVEMGGGKIECPYHHVWTPGPAGQR